MPVQFSPHWSNLFTYFLPRERFLKGLHAWWHVLVVVHRWLVGDCWPSRSTHSFASTSPHTDCPFALSSSSVKFIHFFASWRFGRMVVCTKYWWSTDGWLATGGHRDPHIPVRHPPLIQTVRRSYPFHTARGPFVYICHITFVISSTVLQMEVFPSSYCLSFV